MKRFFHAFLRGESEAAEGIHASTSAGDSVHRATAALLVEMMRADFSIDPAERQHVRRLLLQRFGLDEEQADALLSMAEREVEEASSLFGFTRLVDEACSPEEKTQIVELLWETAYADGRLDKYEEYMVRKLADLLHVRHADMMQAKHRVLERMPGSDPKP